MFDSRQKHAVQRMGRFPLPPRQRGKAARRSPPRHTGRSGRSIGKQNASGRRRCAPSPPVLHYCSKGHRPCPPKFPRRPYPGPTPYAGPAPVAGGRSAAGFCRRDVTPAATDPMRRAEAEGSGRL